MAGARLPLVPNLGFWSLRGELSFLTQSKANHPASQSKEGRLISDWEGVFSQGRASIPPHTPRADLRMAFLQLAAFTLKKAPVPVPPPKKMHGNSYRREQGPFPREANFASDTPGCASHYGMTLDFSWWSIVSQCIQFLSTTASRSWPAAPGGRGPCCLLEIVKVSKAFLGQLTILDFGSPILRPFKPQQPLDASRISSPFLDTFDDHGDIFRAGNEWDCIRLSGDSASKPISATRKMLGRGRACSKGGGHQPPVESPKEFDSSFFWGGAAIIKSH